jgi:redox-regulated HSP33 family molecular chaperone
LLIDNLYSSKINNIKEIKREKRFVMTGKYIIDTLYNYFKNKLIKKVKLSKKLSTKEKSDIYKYLETLSKKELIEISKENEIEILERLRG